MEEARPFAITLVIESEFEWQDDEDGLCISVSIQGRHAGSWFAQKKGLGQRTLVIPHSWDVVQGEYLPGREMRFEERSAGTL